VDDLIDGFIKLFFTDKVHEPVNLGNPTPINMLELAREVLELTGSGSKLELHPLPGDDPKQREPDIAKAKRVLDWQPKVDRKAGLQKTVEYFKTLIG
jgi:nucleoside-diphosphate-sugar epimerase